MTDFTFSPETGRYRVGARLVREQAIRTALDQVITAQANVMRSMSQALLDGTLPLSTWQVQMLQAIKTTHLVALAAGNGGWASLDQSDFGWVGQRIRTQYDYLRAFAQQIASGQQPLTAQVMARSALYAQAARATHRAAQQRVAQDRGMAYEKNVLGAADHCIGCLDATSQGWVEIGTLPSVGARECRSNCRCSMVYSLRPRAA